MVKSPQAKMSSQAHLSLETSHSIPKALCPCPSPSSLTTSSSTSTSTPSLYVTFKVFQLVNSFRKRIQTRVHATRASSKATEDLCQDFERRAYEEIDRYLERKPIRLCKRTTQAERNLPSLKRRSSDPIAASEPDNHYSSTRSVDWLLQQLDKRSVNCDTNTLSTVARKQALFIARQSDFDITKDRLSLKSLAELLVIIKDLLYLLRQFGGAEALCGGTELSNQRIDETYAANLEHLLLCLKDQLLCAFASQVIELVQRHISEWQKHQTKRGDDWFFEWPDSRHPLSTTWPWSIKPSLAVLWGVCWMFYDFHAKYLPPDLPLFDEDGNMLNEQGGIIATRNQVESFVRRYERSQAVYYPEHASAFASGQSQMASPGRGMPMPGNRDASPHSHQALLSNMTFDAPDRQQATDATPDLGLHATYTPGDTYSAAAQPQSYARGHERVPTVAVAAASASAPWSGVPEDNLDFSSYNPTAPPFVSDASAWHTSLSAQQNTVVGFDFPQQQALPPRSRNPLTPTISVTTDFPQLPNVQQQQPQDIYNSATSVSTNSSIHFPDNTTTNYHQSYQHHPGLLSPQDRRFMPSEQREKMQTPPHSPHSHQQQAIGSEAQHISRKRSYSEMSNDPHDLQHRRSTSQHSIPGDHSSHHGDEHSSPRSRTVKRDDPPTNDGKFYCNFSTECAGQTFDRKCEWSKHMDKHDRPYRCPHPSCAKLQGFTYSGGLLRHEREVHGKHGGPKAQLMCPYQDCKRHSGKGFTRKENLNEHVRRVHQNRDPQSQAGAALKAESAAAGEILLGTDDAETPASRISDAINSEDPISPALKRRRLPGVPERVGSEETDDLRQELQRLRKDNAEKDLRLLQMERKMEESIEEMRALQESIRQVQQGQAQSQM